MSSVEQLKKLQDEVVRVRNGGWTASHSYIQYSIYGIAEYGTNLLAAGKSFTTLIACDAYSMPAKGGLYSHAEMMLAKLLELPIFIKGINISNRPLPEKHLPITANRIKEKVLGNSSILELLLSNIDWIESATGVNIKRLIPLYDRPSIEELGNNSYWDHIIHYLNSDFWGFDANIQWLRQRLYQPLKSWQFKKLQPKIPDDPIKCVVKIDGKDRVMNIVDFVTDYNGNVIEFWHREADRLHLFRQDSSQGNNYSEIPEADWVSYTYPEKEADKV